MIFREFDGKELFAKAGMTVPKGGVARSAGEAGAVAEGLGFPVVVKAHVAAGGRGKAGFVARAETRGEVEKFVGEMLGRTHKGLLVEELLIEESLDIEREAYIGVALDGSSGCALFMYSGEGGVEIEQVARETPEKLLKWQIPNLATLREFHIRDALLAMGLRGDALNKIASAGFKLCRAFAEKDLMLAEVNPLALLGDGRVVAADAKVEMDDNALYRQPAYKGLGGTVEADAERRGREIGITYIELDGDIGVVASGAGLAMNTMDILKDRGLSAANFLETGGGITAALIEGSILLLFENPRVRGVVVNLYGGVNSMLEAAKGVVAAGEKNERGLPFAVKILGNQQEEAWSAIEAARFPFVRMVKTPHTEEAVGLLLEMLEARS